jgi:hypothetical protein
MSCGCGGNKVYVKGERGPQGQRGPQGDPGSSGAVSIIAGTPNTTLQTGASVAEQNLLSFNLPADSLTQDDEVVKWIVYGTTGANTRTKTIRFKVDGVTLFTNTATTSPNGLAWKMELNIYKGGNSPGNVTNSFTDCSIKFNGVADELVVVKNVSLNWDQIQAFSITGQVGTGASLGDIIVTGNIAYLHNK